MYVSLNTKKIHLTKFLVLHWSSHMLTKHITRKSSTMIITILFYIKISSLLKQVLSHTSDKYCHKSVTLCLRNIVTNLSHKFNMAANQLTLFSFSTTTQTIPFIVCLKIWLFFLSNIFCNRCLQTKLNITIFYSIVYVARSLCTKVISNCSIYFRWIF